MSPSPGRTAPARIPFTPADRLWHTVNPPHSPSPHCFLSHGMTGARINESLSVALCRRFSRQFPHPLCTHTPPDNPSPPPPAFRSLARRGSRARRWSRCAPRTRPLASALRAGSRGGAVPLLAGAPPAKRLRINPMSDPTPRVHPADTATHPPGATLTACGSTRLEPPLRPRPRVRPKASIPTLSLDESVALAHFIHAAARTRRTGWRRAFAECLGRGHFRPLATPDQTRLLRNIVERHGTLFHCYLRSADVLGAARLPLPQEIDSTSTPREDSS